MATDTSPTGTLILSKPLLSWLQAPEDPSPRFWTLRTVLARPPDDPEVQATQQAIPQASPAREILRAQWPPGYWVAPGIGYSPKHRATIWQVIFLAQLGAPPVEPITRACHYVLTHARLPDGRFTAGRGPGHALLCLNGNLLQALCWFGFREDARVQAAASALAAQIVHEGLRCRFNGRTPDGGCPQAMTQGLPCAWGAIKAGLGLLAVDTADRWHPALQLIERLLTAHRLTAADYPTATEPSPLWWRFRFPLDHTSDALEALTLLGRLGYRWEDPLCRAAVERVLAKRDPEGRWAQEHVLERTWGDFGPGGLPNKWVTLRALRALQAVGLALIPREERGSGAAPATGRPPAARLEARHPLPRRNPHGGSDSHACG